MGTEFDLRIEGGVLVDGTGAARRPADLGVKGAAITAIADPGGLAGTAVQTIDASGLVVAPGFVDIHTHLDAQVFWDPWLTPTCLYGVTTVVSGNCGFTVAPILDENDTGYLATMLSRVEGIPLEPLREKVPWSWRSMGEYLDAVDRTRPALNIGFMAGHSTIRRAVLGEEATSREATADEIERMEAVLEQALAEGALGFSTSGTVTHVDGNGDPVPSRAASDDEILALSEVTGRYEGTQLTLIPCSYNHFEERHTRLLTEMSRRAARPLNWNLLVVDESTDDRLALSDYAAHHGARVLAITYPGLLPVHYTFLSSVFDALPNWPEVMTLPPAEKLRALQQADVRARLRAGIESPEGRLRPIGQLERHTIEKGFSSRTKALEGRRLVDVAAELGVDALDLLLDLQVADELRLGMRRSAIGDLEAPALSKKREELWTDPRIIIGGSDAGAHLDFLPAYNYTAKFLELTREQGEVPLETAVHRLTDMPARLYGLRGRGRIAEGWFADLCLFDPDAVRDGPMDYRFDLPGDSPRLYSQPPGIEHVIVNGVEIVRGGHPLETRPGRVLRSGTDTETVLP
jgi:N-acyl-D-aspartate/D-glutamate deacylase